MHFRVWAPKREAVAVIMGDPPGTPAALTREPCGHWSGLIGGARPGDRYKYQLDGGDAFPDPASRYQPDGPHNPSQIVDPDTFSWTDREWTGVPRAGQVLYEIHIGTFTPEGTWAAASAKLPFLAETGITVLEVMPVGEFPGRFGWGYDGVHIFAPSRLYGTPDDFRSFVDRAHALGLGVILDVVYNHLGPDGNYLGQFSHHYFTDRHQTDWGAALNFDGDECGPAREFFISNASYWIREFHLDGLRFDATQNIYDDSPDHILAAMARATREAAGRRSVLLVAENEPQAVKLVRPPDCGGYGLDMLWNDDYHHSAMVALTGHNDAYYTDYLGKPQEFISALKYGYLYQGQWYKWQEQRRGTPSFGLSPEAFISFIQNHDQIANSARGLRGHALSDAGTYKAITALTLLGPGTPMLFQGQEFAASSPFFYFADHVPELARLVHEGRIDFMSQFATVATPEMKGCLPDPSDLATFNQCKLDWSEMDRNSAMYALHRDLLRIRRQLRPVIIDGAVLGDRAFLIRFFDETAADHLLLVNLGADLHLNPAPEPLLAPPEDQEWTTLWTSEDPKYGGCGTPPLDSDQNWRIPGRAAVLLVGGRPRQRPAQPSKGKKK